MRKNRRCEGLFAIFGPSYSGTTVLCSLLGSHSQIGCGGELHWLISRNLKEASCLFCGGDCRYSTPRTLKQVTAKNIYHEVSLSGGERRIAEIDDIDFSGGHQGGDGHLLERFFKACRGNSPQATASVGEIIRGMVFAFAAETAMRERRAIDLGAADFSIA